MPWRTSTCPEGSTNPIRWSGPRYPTVAATLAAGYVVTGLVSSLASPFLPAGNTTIDLTPHPVEDFEAFDPYWTQRGWVKETRSK